MDTIIISEDKDLRTIAGSLYAPHRPEVGEIEITKLQADAFLCYQTIVGDSTDGYKGATGVGPKSLYAQEVLLCDKEELWDIVLEAYGSVGLNEDEALVQARCARILTADHYNERTGEVILWTPEDML
jgi:DNA polymerase-1